MLFGLRNSLSPTGDSLVPKWVRTTWLASHHSHGFLIHLSELFTTCSSGRPIRFLRIVTPTGRGKTAHAVDAHALIVANVDSHVRWKLFLLCLIFEVNHFIRQKQAFNSTRKFIGGMVPWVRENSEGNPKLMESSGPMIQKSCPRIGIPVPSRTKHTADHHCWMKIGVCVICHMELRFGLHRTGSRKFYSTLMKDLTDDCNAMIARRPCHWSWILRVHAWIPGFVFNQLIASWIDVTQLHSTSVLTAPQMTKLTCLETYFSTIAQSEVVLVIRKPHI